ncbi:hypothetical protein ERJ75_001368700 [Trypanosoma vivax]|uniref:Uncharacterized protein n=1 Tax=Trypanosoma vivax (strain Y486) TaxID=1055687 RepID=G0UCI7_TRYVY|nr:hypothetical protein TRVL_07287 [Trypanosoma vivax]KAH8608171.1 hypothetical protein ERJ75_001367800 [Trypanosoma vivax]KAH8608201.1 hypothetical protein ERJ75_001368700 [Trypanosoma vivax]CCC53547.1 conserved hypothetical protein [Trypanosoma vivax Y486]
MQPDAVCPEELELRFEHALLLSERDFLRGEVAETVLPTSRATNALWITANTDGNLLRAYLDGIRHGDARACRRAEEAMRGKVRAARSHLTELEEIFAALQSEATGIRDHCSTFSV